MEHDPSNGMRLVAHSRATVEPGGEEYAAAAAKARVDAAIARFFAAHNSRIELARKYPGLSVALDRYARLWGLSEAYRILANRLLWEPSRGERGCSGVPVAQPPQAELEIALKILEHDHVGLAPSAVRNSATAAAAAAILLRLRRRHVAIAAWDIETAAAAIVPDIPRARISRHWEYHRAPGELCAKARELGLDVDAHCVPRRLRKTLTKLSRNMRVERVREAVAAFFAAYDSRFMLGHEFPELFSALDLFAQRGAILSACQDYAAAPEAPPVAPTVVTLAKESFGAAAKAVEASVALTVLREAMPGLSRLLRRAHA